MTLEEHAAAISAAMHAASDDGFYIDDGDCNTPTLELNRYDENMNPVAWSEVTVPVSPR